MIEKFTSPALRLLTLAALVTLALPHAAHAYVGPGLGLGAIAVILGIIGSILLAVFAVLWYPIKRMMKKRKAAAEASQPSKD
ncbi:hypothetical protein [uncultured Roseobacter sp.]|uniref:hypothetical protein n=1 Tax=uncultured Roseobacter sp. TaxID=114847 RepID=UPI00263774CB|nr:hypothetical protein [uncultured Roseobacter sp.]